MLCLIYKVVRKMVLQDSMGGFEHVINADPPMESTFIVRQPIRFWARIF